MTDIGQIAIGLW